MPTDGNIDTTPYSNPHQPNNIYMQQSTTVQSSPGAPVPLAPYGAQNAAEPAGIAPNLGDAHLAHSQSGPVHQQLSTLMPFIGQLMQQAKALSFEVQNSHSSIRQYEHLYKVMMEKMRQQKAEIRRLNKEKEELRRRLLKREEEMH